MLKIFLFTLEIDAGDGNKVTGEFPGCGEDMNNALSDIMKQINEHIDYEGLDLIEAVELGYRHSINTCIS